VRFHPLLFWWTVRFEESCHFPRCGSCRECRDRSWQGAIRPLMAIHRTLLLGASPAAR